ncbi:MAG TPA: amidohydrolase, partial [Nitrospirae bacterium]|nr:amidohydrolase [Nitrospirota bacterium]
TAGELGIPILIHFGITHAPHVDYRYTNPLDLQLPSKTFPGTDFIIAHFGAGFFREILLLGFHAENIYIDTSGTNNWREYLPEIMPLAKIFKRTIEVYGAERILYGTDTAINDKTGYRTFVLKEQTKALRLLKIPAKDRKLIMGGNALKLFRLKSRLGG